MKLAPLSIAFLLCASVSALSPAVPTTGRSSTTSLEMASRRSILANAAVGLTAVAATPLSAFAAARPMYLTDPTEEFKQNEAKAMEFKRAQLKVKALFLEVLERFTSESKTEEQLVTDLNTLQDLVIRTGGLPLGIKKDEMFKIIRRKKANGFWPTKVDYAYQELIREISYQQSPNTEKDSGNPL